MPKAKDGSFHMNTQRAMAHDKAPPKTSAPAPKTDAHSGGPRHITTHDHGDGTYHSDDSEGTRTDHPDAMSAGDHVGQWAAGDGSQSDEMAGPEGQAMSGAC